MNSIILVSDDLFYGTKTCSMTIVAMIFQIVELWHFKTEHILLPVGQCSPTQKKICKAVFFMNNVDTFHFRHPECIESHRIEGGTCMTIDT
jgi:hypothetical protein